MSDRMLLGLVGHPVAHSLSPKIHNAALQFCHIEGEYLLFDIETPHLEGTIRALIGDGLKGFNVTIPHKRAVFHLTDELRPEAKVIGAVNTVEIDHKGRMIGHNTDAQGLKLAIESEFDQDFQGAKAIVFGCGGSAQAVVLSLIQLGFREIKILGRDQIKIASFIEEAKTRLKEYATSFKEGILEIPRDAHASVNISPQSATDDGQFNLAVSTIPLGLDYPLPDWMETIVHHLPPNCGCVDLLYDKDRSATPFLKLALSRGLHGQDGIEMLIQQARLAFSIWTGKSVPNEIVKAALN